MHDKTVTFTSKIIVENLADKIMKEPTVDIHNYGMHCLFGEMRKVKMIESLSS